MAVNIALNKPASASSSIAPYLPARAVNGTSLNPADRWLCTQLPGWFCVDLGSSIYFNRWVVRNLQTLGWPQNYNMKAYSLQISDNMTNWTTVDSSVTNNTATYTDKTIQPVKGRYARVYINSGGGLLANPKYASIAEFELYQMPTPNTLSALTLSANGANVPLTPGFSSAGTSYTATVPYSAAAISVTPTATDPFSTIKVNDTVVTSGQSASVPLVTGINQVQVLVTPLFGTPMTYTIAITRPAPPINLSGLTISAGTLTPIFSPDETAYTASVGYDVSSIKVTPSTTISGATITVNGTPVASGTPSGPINLNVGSNNVINVVVTKGTDSSTYTITVTRASNPYLRTVAGIPGVTIVNTTYNYSSTVPNSPSIIKVTPQAEDSAATVKVNGVVVPYGSSSGVINLSVGPNTITIEVISAIGSDSRLYTFTVTRSA